jgi:hypothetical protein
MADKASLDMRRCGMQMTALAVLIAGRLAGPLIADDREAANPESAPFLEDAQGYVIREQNSESPLKLRDKSLLNWTNPERLQERGAIYLWLDQGRPRAIGSFFTYALDGKAFKKHEFHSLSTGPMTATYEGRQAWTPSEPGIVWKTLKDAPKPGPSHVNRLLQMRQIARRFRAEMKDHNGDRTELRLAPRPLFEYSAPMLGVIDGAIQTFVVATDPEVLLLIEAIEEPGKQAEYRYAIARFHYWELAVYDGDDKIWTAAIDRSHELNAIGDAENMSKTYNSFHSRGKGVAEPDVNVSADAKPNGN